MPIIGFGQQTYVPDDNFEQALINLGYDNVLDDYVLTAAIDSGAYLNVSNQNISDLTGIEGFTSLSYLECWNNQLTSLDVSNNPNLVDLYCPGNQLTSIDLTSNIALVVLRLDYNQLTSLDLSNNINLEYLDFFESQLASIDLSQNTNLIELRCGYNQLSSLDLSQNTHLEFLYCQNNLIASIDLTQSTNLEYLFAESNNLTDIDLSNNPNLLVAGLSDNLLYSLDLSYQDIQYIYCTNNQITDLTIESDSLKELFCGNNQFFLFDATNHPNLEMLGIYNTGIFNINLSQNLDLRFLSIGSNPDLWSLDLSNNYNLEHLDVWANSLSDLDMRNGNNQNLSYFVSWNCWNSQYLECISVDDSIYSANNWTSIDAWQYFSNNCNGTTEIKEHSTNKKLLKVTDLLARETKQTNQPLFYIYYDGTVEKRIVIE